MIPILIPFGASLALAILADLMGDSPERRYRKSIEACTADCKATWLKEDGVLRVYHQTSKLNCAQIVVEVTERPNVDIPGRVGEHPVLIKLFPNGTSSRYGATEADAAEKFLAMARAHNRRVVAQMGREIRDEGAGRALIVVEGEPLTERETKYLAYVGERFNVRPVARQVPPPVDALGRAIGPKTVEIRFTQL